MLTQTIRNTFRSWRRTPVLAVSALLTLSLGVGFNAAVFSVVHAVLFRPLPYPHPSVWSNCSKSNRRVAHFARPFSITCRGPNGRRRSRHLPRSTA
jgi:uncharacterized membrane protein